jgi:hypothetical protein
MSAKQRHRANSERAFDQVCEEGRAALRLPRSLLSFLHLRFKEFRLTRRRTGYLNRHLVLNDPTRSRSFRIS